MLAELLTHLQLLFSQDQAVQRQGWFSSELLTSQVCRLLSCCLSSSGLMVSLGIPIFPCAPYPQSVSALQALKHVLV